MVLVSVGYLFYQPMDEKIKTWPLCFPAKENPNMGRHCFDWPVVLQYDVKAKYRLIRSINQSNRSISVRFLFLFCSCAFISRSYENRSI